MMEQQKNNETELAAKVKSKPKNVLRRYACLCEELEYCVNKVKQDCREHLSFERFPVC